MGRMRRMGPISPTCPIPRFRPNGGRGQTPDADRPRTLTRGHGTHATYGTHRSYLSPGSYYHCRPRPATAVAGIPGPFDTAHKKTLRRNPSKGFLKNGETYFHAGGHYHRLGKLNCCVRDGNRWDLSDMVAKGPCEGYFAQHTADCLVMAVRSA